MSDKVSDADLQEYANQGEEYCNDPRRMARELIVLRAEVERFRKDAERYWWLRDRHENGHHQWFVYGTKNDCLDDDIDAAMEGK